MRPWSTARGWGDADAEHCATSRAMPAGFGNTSHNAAALKAHNQRFRGPRASRGTRAGERLRAAPKQPPTRAPCPLPAASDDPPPTPRGKGGPSRRSCTSRGPSTDTAQHTPTAAPQRAPLLCARAHAPVPSAPPCCGRAPARRGRSWRTRRPSAGMPPHTGVAASTLPAAPPPGPPRRCAGARSLRCLLSRIYPPLDSWQLSAVSPLHSGPKIGVMPPIWAQNGVGDASQTCCRC